MGQVFSQLTTPNSALVDSGGNAAMVGSPQMVRDKLIKSSNNFKPFANAQPDSGPPTPGQSPMHNLGIGTPSYAQASTAGATPGGQNALSPGLTKAGKLATLLQSGLQGAMAGRASSEQAVLASGGHRSSGAGMGFEAGYTLPWQRAMQQGQVAQQQAQTEALKASSQLVDTPYGRLPQGIAKLIWPAEIRAGATTEAADTRAQAAKDVAGINTNSRESIAADALAAKGQGVKIPVDETVANLAGMPSLAGQSVGKADWDTVNKALTAKGYKTQDLGNEGLWLIDRAGNRIKRIGESPGVGRMQALAQSRIVAGAPNPEEPGVLNYMTAGQAIKSGALAPQSAPVAASKKAATSAVPTNVGNQKVAFNTAMQHADLLTGAIKALNNGDVQTLNSLKNRFKTEFGVSGPVTADVIASAYTREINKMLTANHITDADIKDIGKTLNVNRQSPEQSLGALAAYKALAQSKMNMLDKQVQAATRGAKKANDPLGIRP